MKGWLQTLIGVFVGIILTGGMLIASAPPRGQRVELLPPPTAEPLVIHVDGAVASPGLYVLPSSGRVADAVEAAGGLTTSADQQSVNLAARLRDGEHLIIPTQYTAVPGRSGAGDIIIPEAPASKSDTDEVQFPIDINTANADMLDLLAGIGETRAADIIAYREAHGGFQSIEEIMEVPGIGPATFERIKDQITVTER